MTDKRVPRSIKIDPKLWKQYRVKAINENIKLEELFDSALRRYLSL